MCALVSGRERQAPFSGVFGWQVVRQRRCGRDRIGGERRREEGISGDDVEDVGECVEVCMRSVVRERSV